MGEVAAKNTCLTRCFLSFDLHCNKLVEISINASWAAICDTIAECFSNVTASGVESLLIMTGQEKDEEFIDKSLLITDDTSFWRDIDNITSASSNLDAVVNVKVIARPAYSIPLALADDVTLQGVIKVCVDETSWEVITEKIHTTFQLDGTSLEVDHIALIDMDGDSIGPAITSAPKLYKRFSKSFNSTNDDMQFLIFLKGRKQKQPSKRSTCTVGDDQMLYDSRGNMRIYGVCEKDLSNAAVFHISPEFSWQAIQESFCKHLSICSQHLLAHFQIWDNKGKCIGPPLDNKETFLSECRQKYSFDQGMFIAAVLKSYVEESFER